ncbi:MAG: PHP domain-containing protein [Dehalococcoidia bacterium]|nr:PHP domain-containing protein [Dehalococcoidia bacterium]
MLRADLHIHTCYSMDSTTTPEQVVSRCQKVGINCVAIADHGTTAGGVALKKIAPFKVIVAEEILANEGEIIGLFLDHDIPGRIPAVEVIARIKDQGGLVYLPHPCDRMRESILRNGHMSDILQSVDAIEVFNARALPPDANRRARKIASEHGIAAGAGSDAHSAIEIGNVRVEMPDFDDSLGFLRSLRQARIVGKRSNPLNRFYNVWARLTNIAN